MRYTPCAYSPSYAKAGGKATRVVRFSAADQAVSIHNHESRGTVGIRGTEQPLNGATRPVVPVFDLAVPGGIIGVLCLFARLVHVSVGNATENLVLREEEKVVRCRRDCSRRCASAAGVVRVLGNGLEDGTERLRNDCNKRP